MSTPAAGRRPIASVGGGKSASATLPTGLHHARHVVLVALADVVVAVGRGAGTPSEVAASTAR